MSGADVEAIVVLEEDRPLRGISRGSERLWFDKEVSLALVEIGDGIHGWDGIVIVGMLLVLLLFLLGGRGWRRGSH